MARPRSAPESRASNPAASRERWWIWGILGSVAVVKIAATLQLADHPLLQPQGGLDSEYYVALARRVAAGELQFETAFFVSPLYIYFLGAVFALTDGSLVAARLCQALIGTVTVGLIYATVRVWAGSRVAAIAAALAGATGLFTFYEVLLLQGALDPFLTALTLWVLTMAQRQATRGWWLGAGLVLGAHALNRPNIALVLVVAVTWLVLAGRSRAAAFRSGAIALGFALALSPAACHNYRAVGEFIPISSHGGLNVFIGNNADADGTYHAVPGVTPSIAGQAQDAQAVAERAAGHALSLNDASAYFVRQSWLWIEAQPAAALGLFVRKVWYVWNAAFLPLTHSFPYYVWDEVNLLRWLPVGPWLLLPLGLFGLLLPAAPWKDPAYRIIVIYAVAYSVSVAVFFVSARYRMPLLVPLSMSGAVALDWLVTRWRARPVRGAVWAVIGLTGLAVATNLPTGLDDGRSEERTAMLLWLVDNGREAEALRRLPAVEADHPEPSRLLLTLGQAFDQRGGAAVAIPLLERSHTLDPARAQTRLALGRALYRAGRPHDAVPELRAGVAADPGAHAERWLLVQALAATGQADEAAEWLERISQAPPTGGSDLLALGAMAVNLRRPAQALRFLDQAISRGRPSAAVHEQRGLALVMLGRATEARADLLEAHRLDPQSASICLNLAVVEAQEGHLDAARVLAREALRLRPDYPQARGLLSTLERVR